jgi:hypothetical protein
MPSRFVFVAKGNVGKLVVDKNRVNTKDADEAKKKCGGGTIYRGRCKGEEGVMVFEVGIEVSPTLAALTKKIIKQDAGLILDVVYRFAADLAAEEGLAAGVSGDAAAAAAPATPEPPAAPEAAPAPPPPQTRGGAEVMKRLNGLAAGIKAALLGPDKAQVQTLFVGVNSLIKSKDFSAADKALDELEPLLAASASAPAAPAAPAAADAAAPPQESAAAPIAAAGDHAALAAEYERRMIALEPKIHAAQKTRAGEAKWMKLFTAVQDVGSAEEYAKALALVEKLEGMLSAPAVKADAAAGTNIAAAVAGFRRAAKKANSGLARFRVVLMVRKDPRLTRIAKSALADLTDSHQAGLEAALVEGDKAGWADQAARAKAADASDAFAKFLQTDRMVALADDNPFGVKVGLRATLMPALDDLAAALKA